MTPPPRLPRLLDALERGCLLLLYVWLVARIITAPRSEFNALLLISEGAVLVVTLCRRPTGDVSMRLGDWMLAIGATYLPLLVRPDSGPPLVPARHAVMLWVVGTFVQVWSKLALGRSFGCVPAHRGLKLGGPYRYVRHPMYLGYVLTHVAFLLMNPTPLNVALYLSCDALLIPRILAEERHLGADPAYLGYRADVPWRLLPGVF